MADCSMILLVAISIILEKFTVYDLTVSNDLFSFAIWIILWKKLPFNGLTVSNEFYLFSYVHHT